MTRRATTTICAVFALAFSFGTTRFSTATAKQPALADPDEQAARRHYDRGVDLYTAERYDDAAREFETARRIKPLPAFDYNIGRSDERMERWADAADAYERYLAASPNAPEARDLRTRIVVLRERARAPSPTTTTIAVAPPSAEPSGATSVTSRWWFWTAIGAVVVAGAAVGIGIAASGGAQAPSPMTTNGTFTVRF